MRKNLLLLFLLNCAYTSFAQDFSNKGKDFWVAYGYHQVMNAGNVQNMVLYFATDQVTNITITIPGTGYTQTLTSGATPTVLTSAPIPKAGPQDARLTTESVTPENKGIHVVSDKPIVAYAHIYNQSVSGASILFPTNTLGKEYYSINYTNTSNTSNSNCWMYVIAADTGTTVVEITPIVATLNHPAGIPFQVTLTQGQVYNLMATYSGNSGGDLTGSLIRSISLGLVGCKRLAVFSGSGRISITCDGSSSSSDNYMVQAFPKTAWGKKYLTASTAGSQFNNIYRICVADPTTVVYINGFVNTLPLTSNFYYEIPATPNPQKIESDKPILVSQYTTSQGACGNGTPGDPEVIYLSPVEQSISKVLWNATPNFGITQHFYNVIIPNSGTALSSFKLDGNPVSPALFTVHPGDANYSYLKQNVISGPHTIQSDSGFNAIAYGFGNAESYGYNAGTNVRDLYQKIGVSSLYGIEATPSVCTGSPFKFKISLPYQPDSMYWDFHMPATVPAIANVNMTGPLSFDSVTVINTRTVWWYSLPSYYTWNTIGNFPITITTYRQNTEGCGNVQEIDFDLEVSDPPAAHIGAPDSVCNGQPVQFTDATISVKPTYHWWWDFGDPASGANNNADVRNPIHTFSGPGLYTVRYSNITTPGCLSDTITKTIRIIPLPTATLAGDATVCVNGTPPNITFTGAASTPPYTFSYKINGGAVQNISTTGTNSSVTLPVPTSIPGTYTYTLVSVREGGTTLCSQAQPDTVTVVVNPLPTASVSGAVTVCQNATAPLITFTGSNGAPPYTFTYHINTGPDLSITTTTGNTVTVSAPTNVTGTFTYTLTNVQGGSSTACSFIQNGSTTITVSQLPTASISGTNEVCLNGTPPVITFTGAGTTGPYTFTYKINNGPALTVTGTGNTATVTAATNVAGTFTYSLVSIQDATANLCSQLQSGSAVITVNPLPLAGFTPGTPSCESRSITFTDASVANAGNVNAWTWNFGDPSSGVLNTSSIQTPVHVFVAPGSYNVTLTVQTDKGCTSPAISNTVIVNPHPLAGFIDPQVCLTDTWAQFTDTSSVPGGTINGWSWQFGDPASGAANLSSVQNPQHSYNSTGPKTVTLYATSNSGCVDTLVQTFIVNGDIPVSNFTINNPSVCGYDSVAIVNTATVNVGSIIKTEIYWDNAGAPAVFETDLAPYPNKVYKHLYPVSQTTRVYNIRYKVYSGSTCTDERILSVTVNAVPAVQFNTIPNTCLNIPPFQILQASETGGVTAGPAPLFSGPGVSPTGMFDPSVVGPGVYMIHYLFTSNMGCADSDSQEIRVLTAPVADFTVGSPACEEQSLTFTDGSASSAGTLAAWTWDFADGTPPEVRNSAAPFTHIFADPGSYDVVLVVTTGDGCKSVPKHVSVTVSPKPVPSFSFPAIACLPNAVVQFTNNSSPGIYNWDFGDPLTGVLNTSSALNPLHIFNAMGPYNVKLQVRSAAGCIKDTTIIVNTIHPQPHADFEPATPSVCFGDPVTFHDLSDPKDGNINSWHWDFGDGNSSSATEPVHEYDAPDSFHVSLYIVNSLGCNSDTMKKIFPVYAIPKVNLGNDIFVLEDGSSVFHPVITENTQDLTYLWTPDLYLNSNTSGTPVTSPLHDITYVLTVTARGGCTASDNIFVKVLLGPRIPNTFTPNNDGHNNTWVIQYLDTYPNNRVQVFTKTGQLVFESRGYKTPWDGTLKGKPLPVDTYYYIIEPGNGRKPMTGYVTILK